LNVLKICIFNRFFISSIVNRPLSAWLSRKIIRSLLGERKNRKMAFRINRFWVTGVLLVLGLMSAGGCSEKKSEEKTAEMAAEAILKASMGKDVDVNIQDGKVQIKDKTSETEIKDTTEWPSDMFSDVPRFTFGKIQHVSKSREEGGVQKFNVHLVSVESDAVNRYAEMLKEKGWEINVIRMEGQGAMLNGQKNNLGISLPYNQEKNEGVLMVFGTP
jgi:hypothetical protein